MTTRKKPAEKKRIGRPPSGKPRRVAIHTTVDVETKASMLADTRDGESLGDVIDRWRRERKETS